MNLTVPTILFTRLDNVAFTVFALIIAYVISYILRKIISASFRSVQNRKLIPEAFVGKSNTIHSVLFSLLNITLFGITILIVLSHWKVDISPILTGAGIFGLAISFGSQTLVKDIISGFFIISESQYNVGDRVKIGTNEGKVAKVTLRLTVLKDDQGNRIFIPNSTITTVTRIKPLVQKSPIIKKSKLPFRKRRPSVELHA